MMLPLIFIIGMTIKIQCQLPYVADNESSGSNGLLSNRSIQVNSLTTMVLQIVFKKLIQIYLLNLFHRTYNLVMQM